MRKIVLILTMFVCIFATSIQAKTTYIPTYDNRLLLIENGEVDSLTNKSHSLVMSSRDGQITCTLAQQVVSEDLVRDIKRAKNAAGWAMLQLFVRLHQRVWLKAKGIVGTSTLEKYPVSLETDISWYVPINNKALKGLRFETDQRNGCIKIDKETMAMSVVSEEEFKDIKEKQGFMNNKELVPNPEDLIMCVKVGKVKRGNLYEMTRKYWKVDITRAGMADR